MPETTNPATFISLYDKMLTTLAHLAEKGAEHAQGLGENREAFLDWRLIGDMEPWRFQAAVVVNFAQAWPARVAGMTPPEEVDVQMPLAGFQEAIAEAKTYLAGFDPQRLLDGEAWPVTFQIGPGMEPTLPGGRWLTGFATTNLYFHLSMAYAILRARGAPIGKVDLFAGGL